LRPTDSPTVSPVASGASSVQPVSRRVAESNTSDGATKDK
jgi:hypothetical protein